jgi:hypothetical protein
MSYALSLMHTSAILSRIIFTTSSYLQTMARG